MTITTKYSLGDIVTGILSQQAERIVKCVTCSNTGKVSIQGDEFVCPKCHGSAKHTVYAGRKWFIGVSETAIGQVRSQTTAAQFSDYGREDGRVEYMLDETGIGSGTIWREDQLFPTREEAQAECDKRNADLKEDEV